jgi:hypothetical protein
MKKKTVAQLISLVSKARPEKKEKMGLDFPCGIARR